jgi:peptidyl-prolyl cis-trans isomerase A (cyclophilin A)
MTAGQKNNAGAERGRLNAYWQAVQGTKMNTLSSFLSRILAPACLAFIIIASGMAQSQTRMLRILIETELGNIEAEVDPGHAPVTVTNFLKYVDGGFYNGGQFHRTVKPFNQPDSPVKIEVIQASINPTRRNEGFLPIPLERTSTTGLSHKDGTLSMARGRPDTATFDFFICIGDQPALDFGGERNPDGQGFAAFGRVIKGMDVVRKIQAAPATEQKLPPPIRIISIRRTA